MAFTDGKPAAYVLGAPRAESPWGANAWVEAESSAGADAEALREAYAAAAGPWVAAGRTRHYVNVPAREQATIEAWFSLGFGLQHVHALREPAPADFRPACPRGLTIRAPRRADIPALARLELVLPAHHAASPVFSHPVQRTASEVAAELKADFDDPRFTVFVAEHESRVVGTAVGCSLVESSTHTALMRPASAGLLGYAAVLPDARGLGAGRALAETVLAWSRDADYEWIAADWRSANLEANRTWRSLGFRSSFYRLYRAIPAAAGSRD